MIKYLSLISIKYYYLSFKLEWILKIDLMFVQFDTGTWYLNRNFSVFDNFYR